MSDQKQNEERGTRVCIYRKARTPTRHTSLFVRNRLDVIGASAIGAKFEK